MAAFVAVSALPFSTSIHPPSTSNTRWTFTASSTPDHAQWTTECHWRLFIFLNQKTNINKVKKERSRRKEIIIMFCLVF
jgi:hypothetical protein